MELPNKPLIEAILELKWVPLDLGLRPDQEPKPWRDVGYPLVMGILYESLKNQFPHVEPLPAQQVPDEMSPGVVKARFRTTDGGWPLVQVGPGVLTVNFTSSYSWERFLPVAQETYAKFRAAYTAAGGIGPSFTSTSLRFINAVETGEQSDKLQFLREKLHVDVLLPDGLAKAPQLADLPSAIDLRLVWPLEFGAANARIASGSREGRPAILFDLSVATSGEKTPQGDAIVGEWLPKAHELIEDWFFALVEGELEQEFRRSD
jgi:uncharacterized protein (TIGR04255 family)